MLRFAYAQLTYAALFATALSSPVDHDSCTSLRHSADYVVSSSRVNVGGTAEISAVAAQNVTETNAASFCRVVGLMPYGPNNTLNFEVWLPENENYNGRYLSVGNGGLAGVIDYQAMATNLNSGFAVGGCDSGHLVSENGPTKPGGYVPFLHSYVQTTAWIRDSISMFTVPAKSITATFFRYQPRKSYFSGCSTGGAQGYALAQYHPDLFDGIVAGCAGNWYTHLILSFLWNGLHAQKPGAFLAQDLLTFARNAALEKCDNIDGVEDGVINDPSKCDFEITSLLCRSGQPQVENNTTTCLNETQLATFEAFYTGPGPDVYPGFAKGSESEWLMQEESLYTAYAVPILQNLVFKNLSYDYTTFEFENDVEIVDKIAGPLITAISPRLDAFRARGGKLIASQGWADPFNAPTWPINQHNEAKAIYGEARLNDFWRLFMVPGGGHCGPAASYPQVPGKYHSLEALIPWVEDGIAPEYVLATEPSDGSNRTRRLCPYPQHAELEGQNADQYEAYTCVD
ncbi:tannase and feruloyl esterase [Alternaria alternata]|uniref:Carboxylic ester hydrolase n=1 Tax=Alternaria alternata TaxID=5599 RepID=A0A177D4D7_ALTAL|nr:tannase and feruloyl esterase [Alternaria alternata]OAG14565.1 tannase and feruloyl esterase [Alternaria alternata]